MHYNDQDMREFAATSLVPRFEDQAFTKPPTLQEARIAIVTSAARVPNRGASAARAPNTTAAKGTT